MATPDDMSLDPTASKPPRPRRWIPLSVRMFVAMLAVVGVAGALWVGIPAYRQHVAIRKIEELGGSVDTVAGQMDWLRDYVRDEWMMRVDDVVFIELSGSEATDATLRDIGGLTSVTDLLINGTQVTDAGLANLKGLTNLRILELDRTMVTDAGMAHLTALTNLQILGLDHTQLTNTGLSRLNALKNLESLSLIGTQVTDDGLAHLNGLANLKVLLLGNTCVTDAGLAQLKGLASVEYLFLTKTSVTEDGIKQLHSARPEIYIVGPFGTVGTPPPAAQSGGFF
jgi:hypothetical protein